MTFRQIISIFLFIKNVQKIILIFLEKVLNKKAQICTFSYLIINFSRQKLKLTSIACEGTVMLKKIKKKYFFNKSKLKRQNAQLIKLNHRQYSTCKLDLKPKIIDTLKRNNCAPMLQAKYTYTVEKICETLVC